MADLLPKPPTLTGERWPRDWHNYDNYQVVHESHIAALTAEGVILSETLVFIESTAGEALAGVNLRGRVQTRSGGVLIVNKWLTVEHRPDGRDLVFTREYDYHAFVREPAPRRDVFRYDNCHGETNTLHRHGFDVAGLESGGNPERILVDRMPTLDLVIRETEFYAAHLRELAASE